MEKTTRKKLDKTKRYFVMDTSALIEQYDVMYKIGGGGNVVIPKVVIRELDGLKNSDKPNVSRAARQVSNILDVVGSWGDLSVGAQLSTGVVLSIYTGDYEIINDLDSAADNIIVGTAIKLKREGKDVTLYSTDTNMRNIARIYGVKAEFSPLFNYDELPKYEPFKWDELPKDELPQKKEPIAFNLIDDPEVIHKIGRVTNIVIPKVVIRELDGLKNSDNENMAQADRQGSRTINLIGNHNDLVDGAKLSTGKLKKGKVEYSPLFKDSAIRKNGERLYKTPSIDIRGGKVKNQKHKMLIPIGTILKVFAFYIIPFIVLSFGLKHILKGEPIQVYLIFFAIMILPIILYTVRIPLRMLQFMRHYELEREVYSKRGVIKKWLTALKYGLHCSNGVINKSGEWDFTNNYYVPIMMRNRYRKW